MLEGVALGAGRGEGRGVSETGLVTLTDFILARIAEDEAWARIEGAAYLRAHDPSALVDEPKTPALFPRVLAECEAKRRIVEEALSAPPTSQFDGVRESGAWTLRALAAIYADHPDYRGEWRV